MTKPRYPLTLRDKLRFRFGLHWVGRLPSFADVRLGDLAVFLAVIAAALFLAWHDARTDAQIAQQSGDRIALQFAQFLNGAAIVDEAQHFAAKCERLIEVTN